MDEAIYAPKEEMDRLFWMYQTTRGILLHLCIVAQMRPSAALLRAMVFLFGLHVLIAELYAAEVLEFATAMNA